MPTWTNWSGGVTASPRTIAAPRDEGALSRLLQSSARARIVGAGHSFTPLCSTEDVLIRLDAMEGDLIIAPDRRSVSAPAGWSLKRLTEAMWAHGLSLPNQGDVNPQSLAGALATGTHGTGATLGCLSTFARAFRFLDANGDVRQCTPLIEPELFQAARISLGMLGVVTRIDVEAAPAFHLHETFDAMRMAVVRDAFLEWGARDHHVEFFVFPYADHALVKRLTPCPPSEPPERDTDMDEKAFRLLCDMCAAMPGRTGFLQRQFTPKRLSARRSGPAYRIFPSERTVRFEEMEYALPRAAGLAALDEIMARVRTARMPVAFPMEVRLVAQDDIWLSPFHAAPSMTIAVHQYAKMAREPFFSEAEAILRAHGGRPHWGKRHTLTRADAEKLYPRWRDFVRVRASVDPNGTFLNPHLAALFTQDAP